MISQTAEYALRAVVYLATQQSPRTTTEIAASTRMPAGYLAKILQNLSRAGIVKSQRGINGGYTLAFKPSELSILAVINAVDPIQRFTECPLGLPEHAPELCPLHRRLDQAAAMVEQAFGETQVAELLVAPKKHASPCSFPLGLENAK